MYKELLLIVLESQGLMKGYKVEVPLVELLDGAQNFDIHAADERNTYKNAAYHRTTKK